MTVFEKTLSACIISVQVLAMIKGTDKVQSIYFKTDNWK
jgi:hypothetical protein